MRGCGRRSGREMLGLARASLFARNHAPGFVRQVSDHGGRDWQQDKVIQGGLVLNSRRNCHDRMARLVRWRGSRSGNIGTTPVLPTGSYLSLSVGGKLAQMLIPVLSAANLE